MSFNIFSLVLILIFFFFSSLLSIVISNKLSVIACFLILIIYLGAVLVLLIYICAVCPNQKSKKFNFNFLV